MGAALLPGGTGNDAPSEDKNLICKLVVLGRVYALPGLRNGLTREKVATDHAAGWFRAWTMV